MLQTMPRKTWPRLLARFLYNQIIFAKVNLSVLKLETKGRKMRYTPRHLFTALIGICFSILTFSSAAYASPSSNGYFDASPPYERIHTVNLSTVDIITSYELAIVTRKSWKDYAEEYEKPVFKDLSKRTGLSFRRNKQPHVQGAPCLM